MDISIRRARLQDVVAIVGVTRDFGNEGIMIPLSVGDTLERIRNFQVAELPDGTVIGCVAIDATWDRLVELRSLAVAREWQSHGVGRRLVEAALADAKTLGAEEIFTLTYVPEFFRRFGFTTVDRNTLPHKVWLVCVKCPKFPDCGEIAMKMPLPAGA
ncbi:MAG: N-acetyltransferase [Planctomycetes bacterium]|nr:N-acetyltransferase [Planctomycetota bacterium]